MSLLGTPPERESMETALRAMSAEFVFLLDSLGIPTDIQAKLAILGYTDAVVFAKMEDSAPSMRASIKTDVGLDPDASPAARAMVARLVTAWEAAGTRAQRRRQEEAEQRVGDLPRTLPKGQHLDLARRRPRRRRGEAARSRRTGPSSSTKGGLRRRSPRARRSCARRCG